MNITGLSSNSLGGVYQVRQAQTAPSGAPGAVDNDGDKGGASMVSGFAQFMSKLQKLEQTDPAKAKQVLGDIASKLKAEAANATGPQADKLNQFAANFDQAAQTGNLSPRQPSGHTHGAHHGGHHGGHHAKAQHAYSRNSGADPTSLLSMMNGVLAADTAKSAATA